MRSCEACTGECCKFYLVNLSGRDVWNIASSQHMSAPQFVEIAQEAQTTPTGFHLDATKMTFGLVLAKRPGPDGRQQCSFLVTLESGIGRCGIYPHRPAACRVFPAQLRDGAVAFREQIVCPTDSWNLAASELPPWRNALLRSNMEWALYASVVSRWNESALRTPRGEMRTPDEYYAYLMACYARLDAIERAQGESEMDAIVRGWGQETAGDEAPWQRFLAQSKTALAQD